MRLRLLRHVSWTLSLLPVAVFAFGLLRGIQVGASADQLAPTVVLLCISLALATNFALVHRYELTGHVFRFVGWFGFARAQAHLDDILEISWECEENVVPFVHPKVLRIETVGRTYRLSNARYSQIDLERLHEALRRCANNIRAVG